MITQQIPDILLERDRPHPANGERPAASCSHCGAANDGGNRFCVNCGQALTRPAATVLPEPAPVEAASAPSTGCGDPVGTVCGHNRLVGVGPRLLAFLVDAVLIGIASSLLRSMDLRAVASLADAVYFVAFWSTTGQTVGMRVLRIRVVRSDGQPLSWVTGLLRYVGYVLSVIACGLGLLWIIWDPRRQGWHDKIAGTLVVRTD